MKKEDFTPGVQFQVISEMRLLTDILTDKKPVVFTYNVTPGGADFVVSPTFTGVMIIPCFTDNGFELVAYIGGLQFNGFVKYSDLEIVNLP